MTGGDFDALARRLFYTNSVHGIAWIDMKRILFASVLAVGIPGLTVSAPAESLTIEDLKHQEAQVQQLAEKNLPATVALLASRSGASGTGVIVNADGLILTAGHVIQNTEEITVLFPDGKSAKAKSLGWNLSRDVGMAQLEGEGPWPHVEIGDSDSLETTDIVVAMGHASGWDATRTPPIRIGRIYKQAPGGFLWSDCTLIGGDSGGPLFTLDGKLVGIHSSIGTSLTHNRHAGVSGFKEDWDDLKNGKRWGTLGGMTGQRPAPIPKGPALGLMLDRETLQVQGLPDNSPAGDAGIQVDDVLKSIGGTELANYDDIAKVLSDKKTGDEVTVTVDRDGQEKEFNVRLGSSRKLFGQRGNLQLPPTPQWRQFPPRQQGVPRNNPFRRPAGPDNGAFFGAQFVNSEAGVVVIEVVKDSPAAKGGVQGGDIVTRIDDDEIRSRADVVRAIRSRKPGDKISVALLRGDSVKTLTVELGERLVN